MSEYQRVFSGRLEHARRVRGVSWKELALRSRIPLSDLEDFAATRSVPHVPALCRLADALNVSTDYLVGRSDYPPGSGQAPAIPGGNTVNYSRASVDRIRQAADRLEREAAELRRVVEHLEGGFDTGDREATPPPHPPDEAPPPTAATYGLKRVRCSGCPERRRCPNILERNRIRKVNKCQECHNAENATRNRLNRAKRKPERPNGAARKRPLQTLKTVRCSGCPERPDCTNLLKRYRVQKTNQCWQCLAGQDKTRMQRHQNIKRSTSQPKLRSVWHGGEGLSAGAPSSLDPNTLPSKGV